MPLQCRVGVQHAVTEHQPEARRVGQRVGHVPHALPMQGRQGIAAAACHAVAQRRRQALEAQRRHRGQQARGIAEVMRRRRRRDTGATRHLAQREAVGPALDQQRLGGRDEGGTQVAMVVGGPVRSRQCSCRHGNLTLFRLVRHNASEHCSDELAMTLFDPRSALRPRQCPGAGLLARARGIAAIAPLDAGGLGRHRPRGAAAAGARLSRPDGRAPRPGRFRLPRRGAPALRPARPARRRAGCTTSPSTCSSAPGSPAVPATWAFLTRGCCRACC